MIQADLIIIAVFGLLVGSFLNVCIWRIPRDESIVFPASKCPSCGKPIKPWDNVPVFSYLLLGGRCRGCKTRISPRYPFVEALNAALYAFVYMRYGFGWHLLFQFAFVSSMIVVTFIDFDFQIIPDRISITGVPVGLIGAMFFLPDPFMRTELLGWANSLIGAASGFGLFFLIAVASRGGMGGGDIKLMATIGAFTGWKGILLTTFAGSLLGSVVGVTLMLLKGKGRKAKIPFGPYLAIGALVALFFGAEVFEWYWHAGR